MSCSAPVDRFVQLLATVRYICLRLPRGVQSLPFLVSFAALLLDRDAAYQHCRSRKAPSLLTAKAYAIGLLASQWGHICQGTLNSHRSS